MYNFHICTSYEIFEMLHQLVCLFIFSPPLLLLVCLLDLAIVRTSEEGKKGLLTLSTRERLIQRCSFDKKNESILMYHLLYLQNT